MFGPQKDFFPRLVAGAPFPQEWWSRGQGAANSQQSRLYQEGKVFVSLLDRLGRLEMPALLIQGRHDHVTGPEQAAAFARAVVRGRTVVFERSSHFARFEEPDLYAQTVIDFVLAGATPPH